MMQSYAELNRIYDGFNEVCPTESDQYGFLSLEPSGDGENGLRLNLNDAGAKGYWELLRPHRDLLICIADGMYHAPYLQTILPRQDFITLRFLLSGALALTFGRLGRVAIPPASVSLLYAPAHRPFELSIDRGCHLCSVTLHMKPELLQQRFGLERDRLPDNLAGIVYGGLQDRARHNLPLYNLPLSSALMNIVLSLINMPYRGARRHLFAEARTTELICRLFQEVETDGARADPGDAPDAGPSPTLKTKLFTAQKILIERHQNPPTIVELARRVGINRNRLSMEFKKLFGVTIFEFCQGYRMNRARELLQDRTLSISQVAEQVGYEHPTNFTAAFKKHYGVLPKLLRLHD